MRRLVPVDWWFQGKYIINDGMPGTVCLWCKRSLSDCGGRTVDHLCDDCSREGMVKWKVWVINFLRNFPSGLACTKCHKYFTREESGKGYYKDTVYGFRHYQCSSTLNEWELYHWKTRRER